MDDDVGERKREDELCEQCLAGVDARRDRRVSRHGCLGADHMRQATADESAAQLRDDVAAKVERWEGTAHEQSEGDGRVVVRARDVAAKVDGAHERAANGDRRERG